MSLSPFVLEVGDIEGGEASGAMIGRRVILTTTGSFTRGNIGAIEVSSVTTKLSVSGHALCRLFRSGRSLLLSIVGLRQRRVRRCVARITSGTRGILRILLGFFREDTRRFRGAGEGFFRSVRGCPGMVHCVSRDQGRGLSSTVRFCHGKIRRNVFEGSMGCGVMHTVMYRRVSLLLRSRVYGSCSLNRVCRAIMFVRVHNVSARGKLGVISGFLLGLGKGRRGGCN